ncbi:roadblock/LC7 domain-containing protein [Variovorax sp. ZS18.2.2]|uniref:roadblock/LC7 domain-containing protein n=1 Tax=Variovorax sp. ZS18.2.2 TaxID=2971255 RepID=UPI0021519C3A|nr:roadblock/LC7 domain-containing protein [Variovorax sp. ZS18.2.2]MCR6478173.1 roadblock/LC7 domain-containing protein [Variovorax sp. ZS18.2.2]
MIDRQDLSRTAAAHAQREARKLVDELDGVTAVVVATIDGFNVASAVIGDADPARVAAMASSIVAIASVVSEEARLGRHKSVIVQTESGFAVFCSVPRRDVELVINVLARDAAVLALVAYRAAQLARTLTDA